MNNISKIIRIGFAVFRAACLFIFLIGVALQFSPIQTLVLNTLVLNKNQTIEIEGFSGLFPFYFSFEKIKLFESGQETLKIKDLAIDWSLLKFLRQRIIAVQTLKINTIEYLELPPKQSDTSISLAKLPTIPFGYISNINIAKATYNTAKKSFNYNIKGGTLHKESGLEFNLQLKNIDDQSNALTADAKYTYKSSAAPASINLDINGKESNGLLHYLIPSLKGPATFMLKGTGQLDIFKGNLSIKFGDTSITGDLITNLSIDNKHIDISTQLNHATKEAHYTFLGTLKTSETLNAFELVDCKLLSKKDPILIASGTILRKGLLFSTKNLDIVVPLTSQYLINSTTRFKLDPKRFNLDGVTKGILVKDVKPIAQIDVPFAMDKSFNSLNVSLKSSGQITDLPTEYQQFSKFELNAKLEPDWLQSHPRITLELMNEKNKVNGILALKEHPELAINGTILAHQIQFDAKFQKGFWNVKGKTAPETKQPGISSTLTAKVASQKKLNFDGTIKLDIESKNIDIEFQGAYDSRRQHLDLMALRAIHKESYLECKGKMDFARNEGDFNWHLYSFNVGDFFLDTHASGVTSILGQLRIDPKDTLITFSGDFNKLALPKLMATSGNLSGSFQLTNDKKLQLSFTSRKAMLHKTMVEEFSAHANGTLNNFSTTLAMSGFADQALKGNLAFSIVDLSILELDSLAIHLGHHKMLLGKPTKWNYLPGELIIQPTTINTNKGNLTFDGTLTDSFVVFNASLKQIPYDLLSALTEGGYFLKGNLNGDLHVSGPPLNPTLKFELNTSDAPYTTSLNGAIQNNVLKTNIDIKSNQLNLKLSGVYPATFHFSPIVFELDHRLPFQTKIIANGTLDNLQQIFDLNYDKIFGAIDANILFTGTINNPSSKGHITVTDGGYERQNIGLKLLGINLNFSSNGRQFILANTASFKDSKDGSGEVIFAKLGLGKNLIPSLDTEIKFKNVHFIDLPQTRRGGMAAVCTGTLKAEGPVNALKIFSRGEISSLEKYIGDTDDAPIYQVNIAHHNIAFATLNDKQTPAKAEKETTYDIDLSLERRFHIYGQGLDSTWKGRLIIQGPSSAPIYKGQFTLQDGQLRILDKFFDVQRGEIYFDGDLSPNLYIESDLNLQDMRVKIILEGDSANLQKKILSDTGLSEQEILQKLFFNRSSTMSQSFQALNYLAASGFISSFINIGFYQQEDPITHIEREFVSLQKKFSKRTYGKVNVAINNVDADTDRIAIAAGFHPTPQTKTEITLSPDKNRVGVGLEWALDF